MYESHFGLQRRPFAETLDPALFVPLPETLAVANRLRYGLEHGTGAALAVGSSGTGKTLLARRLAAALGGPTVLLDYPALPAAELLQNLAEELAAPAWAGTGPGAAVRRVQKALARSRAEGQTPLLVVDEIQAIDDPGTFEALRLLQNFRSGAGDGPDLRLLLLGTPEALGRLPEPLVERLAVTTVLNPLTRSETAAYLQGRLVLSGLPADAPALFGPELVTRLQAATLGLPRRINRLADLTLLVAYARDQVRPDAEALDVALAEAGLDGLSLGAA